jgi:hypothetical protein
VPGFKVAIVSRRERGAQPAVAAAIAFGFVVARKSAPFCANKKMKQISILVDSQFYWF